VKAFEYFRPKEVEEVSKILLEHAGKAKLIGGGTDLLVGLLKKGERSLEYIVSLRDVPGLRFIREVKDQGFAIGAMTTLREIERSELLKEKYPVLSQAAGKVGYIQIRNVATLGGNLCNASPAADMVPPLVCLDAKVRLVGSDGERVISLESFFVGPGETALKTGEWVKEIIVPPMEKGRKATYTKLERSAMDIAIASVGVAMTRNNGRSGCRNVRIVLGAVAPIPLRAKGAEILLEGRVVDSHLIEEAARLVSRDCHPITDVRSSESYRRKMIRVLTVRALKEITEA